jgi:hypothetical protein
VYRDHVCIRNPASVTVFGIYHRVLCRHEKSSRQMDLDFSV